MYILKIHQSLIYSSLIAWTTVQMNRRTSVWCSKHYFFHHLLQNTLQKAFQFILSFFHKITKIKLKSFEYSKSIKSLKKQYLEHQMLGRQFICLIVPPTQREYIRDWRIEYIHICSSVNLLSWSVYIRYHWRSCYSRVHISSDTAFLKIGKKPSIVQE